jgi:prevent-host-death family protein
MRFLAVSKARSDLPTLVDSVERVVLTKNGDPVAVLLHLDDYRAMRAMQRLAQHPDRLASTFAAHERVQLGDLDGFVELHGEPIAKIAEPEARYGEEALPADFKGRLDQINATLEELGRSAAEIREQYPSLDDGDQDLATRLQELVTDVEKHFRRRRQRQGRKTAKG